MLKAALICAGLIACGTVQAQETSCPSREAIWQAAIALVEPRRQEGPGLVPDGLTVDDGGATWVVSWGDTRRTFDDPQRDCAERTRLGSVFVALMLAPLAPAPEPPQAPPPAPPSSVSVPIARPPSLSVTAFGAMGSVAPSDDVTWAPSVGLGGEWVVGRRLGAHAAAALTLPKDVQWPAGRVAWWTLALDAGLLWLVRDGAVDVRVLAGPSLVLAHAALTGVSDGSEDRRLRGGIHVGVQVGLPLVGSWRVRAGPAARLVIPELDVTSEPRGTIGTLPGLFAGLCVSLAFQPR